MDQTLAQHLLEGQTAIQESIADLHGVAGRLSGGLESVTQAAEELRAYMIASQNEQRARMDAFDRALSQRISGLERKVMTIEDTGRLRDLQYAAAEKAQRDAIAVAIADIEELKREAHKQRVWIRTAAATTLVVLTSVGYFLKSIPPAAWHALGK